MAILRPGSDCLILPPKRIAFPALGTDPALAAQILAQPAGPLEKVIRRTAATYSLTSGSGASGQTVIFYVHNPSPRLRCSLSAGWEISQNAAFVAGSASPTWQLKAIRVPSDGGPTADLDTIFVNSSGTATARALPDGYEMDSAVKDVRGTLTLNGGSGFDFNTGLEGAMVLEARWEPHDGVWSEDLRQLIQQADLRVVTPLTISCGS